MAGLLKRLSIGRMVVVASLALLAGAGTGCQNQPKASAADTALVTAQQQNEQLQAELNQQKSVNAQLQTEVERLRAQPPVVVGGPGSGEARPRGPAAPRDEVMVLAGDVGFGSGSDKLTAAGKKELDAVAAKIKKQYAGARIRVEGYSDKNPIKKSNWPSNEALSAARAAAVEKYLVSKGIASGRIESVGRGPVNLKATDAASRRVEIHVLGG